jgi:hypothetical protein
VSRGCPEFRPEPPIVNLNGTSRDELVEQRMVLLVALREAQRALANAIPNGRDWQTCRDSGAFARACAEHDQRRAALRELDAAVELELEAVLNPPSPD